MRQIIIFVLSMFVLVGCASQAEFGDAITEGEPTAIPTPIIPDRQVFEVQRGDIVYQQTYFGRVSAITTEVLMFERGGRVLETFFSAGDDVVAGDVLARLDTALLDAELLDAQEELAVAEALLDSAESERVFARSRAELMIELAQISLDLMVLNASDPPSAEDQLLIRQQEIELELAQLELDALDDGVNPELQFEVTRAQEQVDVVLDQIAQSDLVAPLDGRLTSFSIEINAVVAAFSPIGVVADLTAMEVTDVLEGSQLSELSEGMPVVLQETGATRETYDATIVLLPQPFGSGNDESVHIRFDTTPVAGQFNLGDRMSFVVTIDERQDVLWLPPSAIRQFSGRNFVVVRDGDIQQRVDVQLGLESDNRVEILEGLEAAQMVIAP